MLKPVPNVFLKIGVIVNYVFVLAALCFRLVGMLKITGEAFNMGNSDVLTGTDDGQMKWVAII